MSARQRRRIGSGLKAVPAALLVLFAGSVRCAADVEFPGPDPGKAAARFAEGQLVLENAAIAVGWRVTQGEFRMAEIEDRMAQQTLHPQSAEAFRIELTEGRQLTASDLQVVEELKLARLEPDPAAQQAVLREAGWQASVRLASPDGQLDICWLATLRDHSNTVRTELRIIPKETPSGLVSATVLEVDQADAKVAGTVSGSPIVAGNLFFACEHPLADNRVVDGRVECAARYRGGVESAEAWSRTAVVGVAPPGQLRRAFLYYVERERARPYRLFLHYNSWWDIAWPDRRMDEGKCLAVMEHFGREMYRKRGVPLDSFVFDDGWDDPKTLWKFHDGFPRGFAPHQKAAERQESAIGVWLSPWGGYGQAKADRLEYGKTQGFETNSRGLSLAGPTYYARYAESCKEMISKYGANYFKFDGIGQGLGSPGADNEFGADVEALLKLTGELRQQRPDVYLSITTGTWPSPYWLWYGDSVWRNGDDLGFHGVGSMREQSITYRDMFVRQMIVDRAPLYPLNSLMIVSLCQAELGAAEKMVGDVADLPDEIRMAFAGGTQLLELYVTPSRMTDEAWDVLAQCTRWSRENADVLVDVHWVGGDPGKAEVYGYGAWSPRKGILTLRNPVDKPQAIALSLADALELPKPSGHFGIAAPWSDGTAAVPARLGAEEKYEFKLKPLEMLMIEAVPE